jgi:hypothetical protein
MKLHRPRLQLALAQQVRLIRAEVVLIQLVGRALEVFGEPFNRLDVVMRAVFCTITAALFPLPRNLRSAILARS